MEGKVTISVIDFLKTLETVKVNIGDYSFYEAWWDIRLDVSNVQENILYLLWAMVGVRNGNSNGPCLLYCLGAQREAFENLPTTGHSNKALYILNGCFWEHCLTHLLITLWIHMVHILCWNYVGWKKLQAQSQTQKNLFRKVAVFCLGITYSKLNVYFRDFWFSIYIRNFKQSVITRPKALFSLPAFRWLWRSKWLRGGEYFVWSHAHWLRNGQSFIFKDSFTAPRRWLLNLSTIVWFGGDGENTLAYEDISCHF